MHSRRLASLLIGAWLAASIFMDFVAVQQFRSVDRFLNEPSALTANQIRSMGGKEEVRMLLRHHSGELNRSLFEDWEYTQLVLAVVTIAVFLFGHGEAPRLALLMSIIMLMIVAVDRFYLTPEITKWGRLLDFPNTPGANSDHFWKLHGAYSALELLKIALSVTAAASLLFRRTDRKRFVREHERSSRPRTGTTAASRIS